MFTSIQSVNHFKISFRSLRILYFLSAIMARGRLRCSNTNVQLLSVEPGPAHLEISGCKLPTYEQVLLCFLAHLRSTRENVSWQNKVIWRTAEAVKEKVLDHYRKANIKHVSEINFCQAIIKFYREYCDRKKRTRKPKQATKKLSITPAMQQFKEKLKKKHALLAQERREGYGEYCER